MRLVLAAAPRPLMASTPLFLTVEAAMCATFDQKMYAGRTGERSGSDQALETPIAEYADA